MIEFALSDVMEPWCSHTFYLLASDDLFKRAIIAGLDLRHCVPEKDMLLEVDGLVKFLGAELAGVAVGELVDKEVCALPVRILFVPIELPYGLEFLGALLAAETLCFLLNFEWLTLSLSSGR